MALRPQARFFSVLALVSVMGTGCAWYDDTSDDNFHYKSTPHMPLTVTLVDTRTDSEVWSRDVPVGTGLKLAFSKNGKADDPYGHSTMSWKVTGIAKVAGDRRGRLQVPTRAVRRIDLDVREPVELYQPVAEAAPIESAPMVTPEPMPEASPEPMDEPAGDAPAEEPVDAASEETAEQPADEPIRQPFDDPSAEPASEPADSDGSEPEAESETEPGDADSDDEVPSDEDAELDLPPPPPPPAG